MDEEDLLPQKQPLKPKDLTLLGIAELEEYIARLEGEIARARGINGYHNQTLAVLAVA